MRTVFYVYARVWSTTWCSKILPVPVCSLLCLNFDTRKLLFVFIVLQHSFPSANPGVPNFLMSLQFKQCCWHLRLLWCYCLDSVPSEPYHLCCVLLSFGCVVEAVGTSLVWLFCGPPFWFCCIDILILWCYHLDAVWLPFGFCGVCSWCFRIACIWCFHGTCCGSFCAANLQFIALELWCCCILLRLHHLATDYKIYSCVALVPRSISLVPQQPLVD